MLYVESFGDVSILSNTLLAFMNALPMTLQDELAAFYKRNGFGEVVGARPLTVPVYTGCMLV